MVYSISAAGNSGFHIISEDKEVMITVKKFDSKLPTKTVTITHTNQDILTYSGQIIFETDNEIVIKDKIAYIK